MRVRVNAYKRECDYGYTQEGVIRVPQSRNDIFQTCKPEGEKAGEPKGQGE